jgi:hypothetical protein
LGLAAASHAIADPAIIPIKSASFGIPKKWQVDPAVVRQGGPLLKDFHPVVPDNGYHNFLAAFRKRCNYYDPGRVTPRIISSTIHLVNELAPKALAKFEWHQAMFDAWNSKFGNEKQARMIAALDTFCTSNVKDYSRKEVFVKTEALLVGHKPNWAPRVIYKGTDLYNAVSGPVFNHLLGLLDRLCEGVSGDFKYKLAYKKTPEQYVPFVDRQPGEFIESDFSKNDMLQCADVQALEIMLMRRLGCPEWFLRLHAKTDRFVVENRKHAVRAVLEHQLPTGVTDTTFRNCFWNMAVLRCFLHETKAVSCRALILGDDMLARVVGLKRYACKTYVSLAKEARMEATVSRHSHLVSCSFLSKCFIPSYSGFHFTVPLLGKNLAKFNMRANLNQQLSDHAYFAGKAVGYAYEFRFVPPLRDLFLDRFSHEWKFVASDGKHAFRDADAYVSWNARAAGVTLAGIRDKIVVERVATHDEFHGFCYHRYGLTGHDVIDLFADVVLDTSHVDVSGHCVTMLAADFV